MSETTVRYHAVVIIETDTFEHARQVLTERIGYDEQYEDESGVEFDYALYEGTFPYTFPSEAMRPRQDHPGGSLTELQAWCRATGVHDRIAHYLPRAGPSARRCELVRLSHPRNHGRLWTIEFENGSHGTAWDDELIFDISLDIDGLTW